MRALGPTCKEYCSDALYKTIGERFWPEVFAPVVQVAANLTNYEQALEYMNQGLQYAADIDPRVAGAIAGGTVLLGGAAYYIKNRNGKVVLEQQQTPTVDENSSKEQKVQTVQTAEPQSPQADLSDTQTTPVDAKSQNTEVVDDAVARLEEERQRQRQERELQRQKAAQEREDAIKVEAERVAKEKAEQEAHANQRRLQLQRKEAEFQAKLKQEQEERAAKEKEEQAQRLLAVQKALEEKSTSDVDDTHVDKLAAQAVFGQKLEADARVIAFQKDLAAKKSLVPQPLNLVALTQVQGATMTQTSPSVSTEQSAQKIPVNDIVVAYIAYLKQSDNPAQKKQGQTFGARRASQRAIVDAEVLTALGLDPKGFAPTSSEGIEHYNQQMVLIGKENLQLQKPIGKRI